MPEGDNIHAHAAELSSLVGVPLTGVWARAVEMRGLRGRAVASVEAIGKHLVIAFDEGSAVRVHLGIAGCWRRSCARVDGCARRRRSWRCGPRSGAWLCKARTIEWSRARFAAGARALTRLGPDLLADAPDLDAVLARAREPRHAARPIGELLLDQSGRRGARQRLQVRAPVLARPPSVDARRRHRRRHLRALFADGIKWLRANVGRTRTMTADLVARRATAARPGPLLGLRPLAPRLLPLRDCDRAAAAAPVAAADLLLSALSAGDVVGRRRELIDRQLAHDRRARNRPVHVRHRSARRVDHAHLAARRRRGSICNTRSRASAGK